MPPTILTESEYEANALRALVALGMPEAEAREFLNNRWPMCPEAVLSECRCRGLSLRVDDLTAYLRHTFARDAFPDGSPLVAEAIGWPPRHVDGLLGWAVAEGRGMSTVRPKLPPVVTVAAMLAGLRSADFETRIEAGCALARSLATGLAIVGETREDFEYLIAPQLSLLLGRAMAGESAAVDELAAAITNDLDTAFRPNRTPADAPARKGG